MEIPRESEIEFDDPEREALIDYLEQWGKKRGLEFKLVAEVGNSRACVGFLDKRVPHSNFVDYNPLDMDTYDAIDGLYDERLRPPDEVKDAYHKFDCLCVLRHDADGTGEEVLIGFNVALKQMKAWIDHLDTFGRVVSQRYETGAMGAQALFTGEYGYALKIVE